MQSFRSGERPSTVMGRIAKGFSENETRAISEWLTEHAHAKPKP
jgi:cytochrome c553